MADRAVNLETVIGMVNTYFRNVLNLNPDLLIDGIVSLPTVDAVPVRHGRWIYHIDDLFPAESTQECDQCHEEQPLTCGDNFCPNCGADMRKDGDNHG